MSQVPPKEDWTVKIMNLFVFGIPLQIFGLIILSLNNSLDFEIQYLGESGLGMFLVGAAMIFFAVFLLGRTDNITQKEGRIS